MQAGLGREAEGRFQGLEKPVRSLAGIEMPSDLVAWGPDPEGKDAYPIVTYTWIMCYQKYADKKKADTLKDVLKYCLTTGQESAEALGYIPLPEKVSQKVIAALDKITAETGKASLWRPLPYAQATAGPYVRLPARLADAGHN